MTEPAPTTEGGVTTVAVRSAGADYDVVVAEGLLDGLGEELRRRAPAATYAIVSDERVAELWGARALGGLEVAGLEGRVYAFPPGEASKTRATWSELTDRLLADGVGRDGCVVALGGGVSGDLGGFVAATYLRGVALVQVPTSLLAMVDASIGGKVGVDAPAGKNLVGAFHPPRAVLTDLATLATLPAPERAQGLVEALKHGAILDAGYMERVAEAAAGLGGAGPAAFHEVVATSVGIKARVVSDDEREAGLRQILNFGHTLGHALETASGYRVSHGAAVAAGMVLEARLGERIGVTRAGTAATIERAVAAFGFGVGPPDGVRPADVLGYLTADKKARRGRPRYVLLERVGAVARGTDWSHEVAEADARAVLEDAWRG